MSTRKELIINKFNELRTELEKFDCLKGNDLIPDVIETYGVETFYNYFKQNLFEIDDYPKYVKTNLDEKEIKYSNKDFVKIYILVKDFIEYLKKL